MTFTPVVLHFWIDIICYSLFQVYCVAIPSCSDEQNWRVFILNLFTAIYYLISCSLSGTRISENIGHVTVIINCVLDDCTHYKYSLLLLPSGTILLYMFLRTC